MRIFKWYVVMVLGGLCVMSSCELIQPAASQSEETPLASVADRHLYRSDLLNIIHPNTSSADSTALATAYIDQWVRDQLMARQASTFFSTDEDIDRLVDDYRSKLLKHNLEEQIISARYDTAITNSEMQSFYDRIKDQFILQDNIYRCQYMKIGRRTTGISDVIKDWHKDRDSLVVSFAQAYGEETLLDTTMWLTQQQLDGYYPRWSSRKMIDGGKQRQRDADYEYFLKIVRRKDRGEISPLSYIRSQLTRMILRQRKKTILEEYKQELYEQALNNNVIKINE